MSFFCNPSAALSTAAFFYGNNIPIPELCMYNIAVIDPASDFNPKDFCNTESQVFAYVSLGEVAYNASYKNKIKPEWIIGKNIAWNQNHVIDQTQKGWQDFFVNQLITPLWDKGYRGFFLDTLDSYFLATHNSNQQQQQIQGMVSVIKEIKRKYPDTKIILNRGFQLLPYIKSDISAVVIESLYNGWYQDKKIYQKTPLSDQKFLFEEIKKIKEMNIPIIVIDYLPPKEQSKASELATQLSKQGLIPWITDKDLKQIYIKKLERMPRKILVLFSEKHKNLGIVSYTGYVFSIGTILEYFGYIPKYINLEENRNLAQNNLKKEYAGIVIYLNNEDPKNDFLLTWAQKQIKDNIPVVFMGNFGVPNENKKLAEFGITFPTYEDSIKSLQINKINKTFVDVKANFSVAPYNFFALHANNGQVLLQMKNAKQQLLDAVAITPWGGYALSPYVVEYFPNGKSSWIINPLTFFYTTLRLKDFPIPDTTTENGRRLMSVHIDGDGFPYQAKWIGGKTAAEELRDRVLKRYRIPTSVSVITGEIAPNGMYPKESAKLVKIARSIFELPWIEVASHTFSHPFNWQLVSSFQPDIYAETIAMKIPHYRFNFTAEVVGSIDYINKYLTPPDKKCNLIFWSGLANPSPEDIAITYKNHILNINGGNQTNISYQHPSLTAIQPRGVEMGGYYQIFAPIDLDFYYMDSLGGPLYGFEKVIQTLTLTDKPIRFKPIDLYYHIYGASYPASLKALYKVYDWALTQPVMHIYISDYIKKVLDFYNISISKLNNAWMIYTQGDLRELRSPKKLGYPDLMHSQNIIGFNEINNNFYIHLGPNRLSILHYQQTKPMGPYLIEANARVVDFMRDKNSLFIKFKGYTPLQFTLANTGKCKISSQNTLKETRNKNGNITYSTDKDNNEIHINC